MCAALRSADLVRSIGADHVIDYTQEDFTRSDSSTTDLRVVGTIRCHSSSGSFVPGERSPVGTEEGNRWVGGKAWIQAMLLSRLKRHLRPLASEPNQADLQFVTELIEAGKITPVIDQDISVERGPGGDPLSARGTGRGKIVITV